MTFIFRRKVVTNFLLLLLLCNCLNLILFFVFKYILFFDRPLFQIEYFLWFPLVYFFRKPWIPFFIFLILFLLDILESLSMLFSFNIYDYIYQIGTFFRLRFAYAYLSIFIFCILIVFLFTAFIKRKMDQYKFSRKQIVVGTMIFIICISVADILNGSTYLNFSRIGKGVAMRVNISSSFLLETFLSFKVHSWDSKTPLTDFTCEGLDSSVTFKNFCSSSHKKELLIIAESWGLYKNNTMMIEEFKNFTAVFDSSYKIHYGTSYFKGATMNGELRELFNKEGSPYNILQPNHFLSIADLKKRNGYFTTGIGDTYKYLMLQSPTWHVLHFDTVLFLNDFVAKDPDIPICYETAYLCIKDEVAFDSLCSIVKNKSKSFSYFLTTNTHLPFYLDMKTSDTTGLAATKSRFVSAMKTEETFEQYFRFIQFFKHAAKKIKENGFEKIVLVGDHRPPVMGKELLDLYIEERVPYIIIEKK